METLDTTIEVVNLEVDLNAVTTIGVPQIVRKFECSEAIIDQQAVILDEGRVKVARLTDPKITNVLGIALQSVREGDLVDVLVSGVFSSVRPLQNGIVYLGDDAFVTNSPPNDAPIVILGYCFGSDVYIFDNKEIVLIN